MAMRVSPKNEGSKILFSNPMLEKLARTHFMVPVSLFVGTSGVLLWYNFNHSLNSVGMSILYFFLGFLTWTWLEYQLHKHVFHMLTHTKFRETIQYTFHGVHHEYPRDKTRLAMPPVMSSLLILVLFVLLRLIMGDVVFTFLPGFLVGYSAYLFIHYSVHAFVPPKNFLKVLWINHSVHHYNDDTVAFGVSSPLWDVVYGTLPPKNYNRRNKSKKESPSTEEQAI